MRALGADDGLRQTWARYHLIRDCLRYQDGQLARNDLSSRVQRVLSDDPVVPPRFDFGRTWLKPFIGAALAASVALIAILTVSQGGPPGTANPDAEMTQTAAAESFASPNISSLSPVSQPVSLSGRSEQDRQRMNAYLLRHYQVTEGAGGRGFVSFVPIVVTQAPATVRSGHEEENKETESVPR
jgi:sigma-E factor negative regulatory protein RseA